MKLAERYEAFLERRRRKSRYSVKEMAGKIASLGKFQGNVVKAYRKRLDQALRYEEDKSARKLLGLMERLEDLMDEVRREASKV